MDVTLFKIFVESRISLVDGKIKFIAVNFGNSSLSERQSAVIDGDVFDGHIFAVDKFGINSG